MSKTTRKAADRSGRTLGSLARIGGFVVCALMATVAVACTTDAGGTDDRRIFVYIKEARFIKGAPPAPTGINSALVVITSVVYGKQTHVAPVKVPFKVTWTQVPVPTPVAPVAVTSAIVEVESLGGYFEVPVPESSAAPVTSVEFDMGFSTDPVDEQSCTGNFNGPGKWCWAEAPPAITTSDINFRTVTESGQVGPPDTQDLSISWGPPPSASDGDGEPALCAKYRNRCYDRDGQRETVGLNRPAECGCPPPSTLLYQVRNQDCGLPGEGKDCILCVCPER